MMGGQLGQRPQVVAIGQVVLPRVIDRLDLLQPERVGDVAGHRVGVDQQHPLTAPDLERRGEVHRDRRLADAALRIEYRDDRRPLRPGRRVETTIGLDDRTLAVVDRLRPDEHRLDPPAQGVG